MSNQWFRLYSEFSHDPKVQMMSEAMQRRYIMLMCLRCSNALVTLHETEIAFHLRISDEELAETKSLFMAKGFIDSDWNLMNWDKRQLSSDNSRDRVAKHRALQKAKQSVLCNGDVTLQVTTGNALEQNRTDTDTSFLSETSFPPCPYAELLRLYARRLPELPQPRHSLWVDGAGGKAMKARWRWVLTSRYESGDRAGKRMAETEAEALDWFDRFFEYVARSNWLMGRDRNWNCNLAWLMKLENFTKVLSGNYDNKAQA